MERVSMKGFTESLKVRVGIGSIALLGGAFIAFTLIDRALFPSFLAGWLLAHMNLLGLWWTIKRGMGRQALRARYFAVLYYYLRFGVTVGIIGFLVFRNLVNPWCLLLGLTVTSVFTIILMIYNVRRGAFDARYHTSSLWS